MTRVKELRILRNIKQREMARIISTSPCNYSKKENGTLRFDINEAKIIAEYFKDSIENIFLTMMIRKSKQTKPHERSRKEEMEKRG